MSDNDQTRNIEPNNGPIKKSKKKLFLYILIPIAIILISVLSYGAHLYNKAEKTVEKSHEYVGRDDEKSNLRDKNVDPVDDNVSILIIGIDASEERLEEEHYRSDALILATFNKKRNSVKLLSIPRDSYVYVPEVDYYTKINHAHHYGGPKAAIETVENLLNVPVDYYVQLNFNAFIDVVDAIDGINFNVPYDISEINTKGQYNKVKIDKGFQTLNGEQALALARTRKYDSDIKRGERQQEIIKIIAKKVASPSSVFKIDNLMEAVGDNMKTNLTFKDIKSFFSYATNTNVPIESINFDGDGGKKEDGIWYYQIDDMSRDSIENELRAHLNLPIFKQIPEDISEFAK